MDGTVLVDGVVLAFDEREEGGDIKAAIVREGAGSGVLPAVVAGRDAGQGGEVDGRHEDEEQDGGEAFGW